MYTKSEKKQTAVSRQELMVHGPWSPQVPKANGSKTLGSTSAILSAMAHSNFEFRYCRSSRRQQRRPSQKQAPWPLAQENEQVTGLTTNGPDAPTWSRTAGERDRCMPGQTQGPDKETSIEDGLARGTRLTTHEKDNEETPDPCRRADCKHSIQARFHPCSDCQDC